MRLERKFSIEGIPFVLKENPSKRNSISVTRDRIPDTEENFDTLSKFFSEVLYDAFESKAYIQMIDIVLVDCLREFHSIENNEYNKSNVFFLDDSFFGWEYTLLPKTKKEEERYSVDELVLWINPDSSDSNYLTSHFKSSVDEDGRTLVYIPLHLIRYIQFKEHY